MIEEMTKEHYALLMDIKGGADIMARHEAKLCREIEELNPSYIGITKFMGDYHPSQRLPYFGAIATAHGVRAARKALAGDKKVAYL